MQGRVTQNEESPEPGVRQQDRGHYDLKRDNTLRRHLTEAVRDRPNGWR